jgi:hypothetical protein
MTILEVGQIWQDIESCERDCRYRITRFEIDTRLNFVRAYADVICPDEDMHFAETFLTKTNIAHEASESFLQDWCLSPPPKPYRKDVPGTPLDPTMHILQAGYIQDRQRKRHKRLKHSP